MMNGKLTRSFNISSIKVKNDQQMRHLYSRVEVKCTHTPPRPNVHANRCVCKNR